jgi:hypothetical protein
MLQDRLEEFAHIVGAMQRDELIERMLHFRGRFPVDFTPAFLARQSDERLRHIFLAMCLQQGELPTLELEAVGA